MVDIIRLVALIKGVPQKTSQIKFLWGRGVWCGAGGFPGDGVYVAFPYTRFTAVYKLNMQF